jgi:hypothetical protein
MAKNFMKDILGFGIPDVYGGILNQDQLNQLSDQATKRGITMGILDFITTPKTGNFGSITPYIGKAVGSGLQSYQGGLDAGLAGAIKAKALETDTTPKVESAMFGKYTPQSIQKFKQTGNYEDLDEITKPADMKGLTQGELQGLITSIPGLADDQVTQQLLMTDRTKGLSVLEDKYIKKDAPSFEGTQINALAKANFGGKINSQTGELYSDNVDFGGLNPQDALAIMDEKDRREMDLIIGKSQAEYDSPGGKWQRITTLNNKYEQALKSNQFSEMEKAFQQVQSASRQGTPIGDVATAIKIMKLLDPGSVVRESELGIALNQTSGLVDRWKTFIERKYTGEQLTETQRKEFREIANDFYKIAQASKNKLDARFINYAKGAGVDPSLVVGTSGGYLEYDEETGEFK